MKISPKQCKKGTKVLYCPSLNHPEEKFLGEIESELPWKISNYYVAHLCNMSKEYSIWRGEPERVFRVPAACLNNLELV